MQRADRHGVKVIEVATAEMFTKIMQDYKSGADGYDALGAACLFIQWLNSEDVSR